MITRLIAGLIKKISLYKMSYCTKPDYSRNKIKIKFDLSNYAATSDLNSESI